jgi:hypothetical protein
MLSDTQLMTITCAGTAWSGFGTWKGTAMCPEGQEFVVGQTLRPASALASYPKGGDTVLQVREALTTLLVNTFAAFTMCQALRPASGLTSYPSSADTVLQVC